VVGANVAYPSDSGLLVKAIRLIMTLVAWIHAAGASSRTHVRDRRRSAGRRARSISAHLKLRNDDVKTAVPRITGELAGLAEVTVDEATRVLVNARRHLARTAAPGRLASAVDDLHVVPGWASQMIARPGLGWPARRRPRRPGWCPCTMWTRGRSPRADSANRSRSAVTPRSAVGVCGVGPAQASLRRSA
jgi:hypothetical protein